MNDRVAHVPTLLRALQALEFPHKLGICEGLFGRHISRLGIVWIRTAAAIDWKLDLGNPTHRWIVYGKYEGAPFLDWAKSHLPPDGIVVDSGANIGQMVLYFGQYVSRGRVLAFEPGKDAADWLAECLGRNASLPVELIRAALGDSNTTRFLRPMGSEFHHGAQNQISASEGEPVAEVRLDDVLRDRGIDVVHLWKLDVEGHEMQALKGAESCLARKSIHAIYAELAFGHGNNIVEYLRAFGYRCHLFDAGGGMRLAEHLPSHTNGLFLPA